MSEIAISVWRDGRTDQLQLSIGDAVDGYRLAGPKFNGSGHLLLRAVIDVTAAFEIRHYLDRIGDADVSEQSPSAVVKGEEG